MYTPAVRTHVRTLIIHEHGEPSSVGGRQGTGSEVINESNPTLASLRKIVREKKN